MIKENLSMVNNNGLRIFYYIMGENEHIEDLKDEYFFREASNLLKKNDIINIVYSRKEHYYSKQILINTISIVKGVVTYFEIEQEPVYVLNEENKKTSTKSKKKIIEDTANGTNNE